jgi:GH24 family phage-related lysozyme (muramidase)
MTRDDIMAVQRLLRALGRDVAIDGVWGPQSRAATSEALRVAAGGMATSDAGVGLIKDFEALRTKAYLDAVNVPTIGYGHTKGVKMGTTITAAKAEALLREDLSEFEAGVNDSVLVPLRQNEFDALVSFSFNVGTAALRKSTLMRKLNAGDYEGAAAEFARWNSAGGTVLAGLTRRRAAERELFLA